MKTYDLSPKPAFLLGLANQKWTAAGAISELFDNSLGRERGNAKYVEAIWDSKHRSLIIFDNGQGMNHIGDLFRLGQTVGMGPGDIGRYGNGGTMALIWLASSVRIWTMRNGKVMLDEIIWKDVMAVETLADYKINNEWEVASIANTPTKLFETGHGTFIELKVRSERTISSDYVQQELSRTYAPAIRHGKTLKWTNARTGIGHTLTENSFVLPPAGPNRVNFDLVVKTEEGHHLPVNGAVGLIEDLPYKHSRIAVGFGPRVIFHTRECYQSSLDPDAEKYSGNGVAGWLDLGNGWQNYFTTYKDGIHDDRVRIVLMHHVYESILPLLKRTEDERMSVVFDGIALELESALNNLGDIDFTVDNVGSRKREHRGGGGVQPTPDPDNPIPEIETNEPDEETDGEMENETPAQCKIALIKETNENLSGALCRVQRENQYDRNFKIEINNDHPIIKTLMTERPLNKVALHLMLCRELAAGLLEFGDNLINEVLPQSMKKQLAPLSDTQKQRTLYRLLFDSAKRAPLTAEETKAA